MWEWTDDRWHLDGKPVHAGEVMEIRWPDGTWECVRIESTDSGRKLFAYFDHHGEQLRIPVHTLFNGDRQFRWR